MAAVAVATLMVRVAAPWLSGFHPAQLADGATRFMGTTVGARPPNLPWEQGPVGLVWLAHLVAMYHGANVAAWNEAPGHCSIRHSQNPINENANNDPPVLLSDICHRNRAFAHRTLTGPFFYHYETLRSNEGESCNHNHLLQRVLTVDLVALPASFLQAPWLLYFYCIYFSVVLSSHPKHDHSLLNSRPDVHSSYDTW